MRGERRLTQARPATTIRRRTRPRNEFGLMLMNGTGT